MARAKHEEEKRGFWSGLAGRIFGVYDPEDYDEDFGDPAEVKPKKKEKEKKECPWGPIIPSDMAILIEVARAGQKQPDLFSMTEYREILYRESGGQPSADLNAMIMSRARCGDIAIRLYWLDARGHALTPVEEDWCMAPLETYNRRYNAEIDRLNAEKEQARRRAREAQEAQNRPADAEHQQMVEDLVNQAKTLNFEQKRDLIEMVGGSLSDLEKTRILMAKPDQPNTGETGGAGGDPFEEDND